MHKFSVSLKKGKDGEYKLLEHWPDLEKLDGRRSDFRVKSTGQLLELKSDQYDMAKTENFFIELWSDSAKLKPGGPMQAMKHDSELWVYMFVKNDRAFIFKTNELVDWILKNAHLYKRIQIVNKSWITTGIKVPRDVLYDIYTILELKSA